VSRRITETKKRWELVTSHTARRSFATQMILLGFQPSEIMPITGHSSLTEFMKYIRIDREQSAKEMAQHPFFKKSSFQKAG
jgi:integrase